MPTLTLTVLRHPEYGSAEQRHVPGTSLTIGRGAECDWALPDPLKSLSRRHCQLECVGGAWQVRDLSSNGTFVNQAASAIGRDAVHALQSGDRIRLGDYEIEVRISSPEANTAFSRTAGPGIAANPFGDVAPRGFAAVRLPGLDDPLPGAAPRGREPSIQSFGAMPDHAAASAEAFVPPPAAPSSRPPAKPIVPDDWYLPSASATPAAPVADSPWSAPPAATPPPPPSLPPAVPTPPAAPVFEHPAPAAPVPPARVPDVELPAVVPAAAPAGASGSLVSAIATLMAGGQLPPDAALRASADPETALRNAGALLRTAVGGIRGLLIARGSLKREFRIEQTLLRPKENNPLKFAPSDEHALTVLLDPRTSAVPAVQEAIRDLTLHQIAVLAATQAAARALLDQLDPAELEAEDPGGGLFSDSLEKRLWEAYKRRHAKLIEQFEDDFESAFGKSFARAYEQAVQDDES